MQLTVVQHFVLFVVSCFTVVSLNVLELRIHEDFPLFKEFNLAKSATCTRSLSCWDNMISKGGINFTVTVNKTCSNPVLGLIWRSNSSIQFH